MSRTPTYLKGKSPLWWLANPRYLLYMLREVSSFFVYVYVLVLLGLLVFLGNESGYEALRALIVSLPFVLFTLVTLAFALVHSITWWHLTSKVVRIPLGRGKLPRLAVLLLSFGAWALVSVAVYYLIFLWGW